MLYPYGKSIKRDTPTHTAVTEEEVNDMGLDSLPLIADAIAGTLIRGLAKARPRQRGG